MPDIKTGIQEVVDTEGSQRALAARMGVSEQVVGQWVKRGWVPMARAFELESRYGVSRERLLKPVLAKLLTSPSAN